MSPPLPVRVCDLCLCDLCVCPQVFVWDLKPQQSGPPVTSLAAAAALAVPPTVRVLRGAHKEPVVAAGWSSNCCQMVTADKGGYVAFWQCIET